MPPPEHQVLLDVDTGTDDALALIFALAHPAVDVLAVTCVSGNVGVDDVVANTLHVLDAVDAPPIPVAAGARRPIISPPHDASEFHGPDGLAGLRRPSARRASESSALALMESVLTDARSPVTIVALGPQTNIATFLLARPDLARAIDRIVFMGGAISTGNVTATAEFNVWHDPEAAAIVLRSGIPMTMYPLEPFMSVRVEPSEAPGDLAGRLLAARHSGGIGDAGALLALVAPHLVTIESLPVSVTLAGPERGQTVIDRREWSDEGANVDVITAIDARAAAELFLETTRDANK